MFKKTFELALISLSLLAAFAGASSAAERPYVRGIYGAPLTQFNLDQNLEIDRVRSGRLTLDLVKGTATVILQRSKHCPPGMFCTLEMPAPYIAEAKVVSIRTTGCGSIQTIARRDDRRADGIAVQIEITDNSRNRCQHLIAIPSTQVVLKTAFPRSTVTTRSVMTGDSLRD